MPCSSEISNQWLLRLVVDVAVSSCQQTVWLDTCASGAQLSVVAGRSGCRSVTFSFPTYVGCMSFCSGHFWVGSLKPIHHEIVLGSWAQVEVMRGHQCLWYTTGKIGRHLRKLRSTYIGWPYWNIWARKLVVRKVKVGSNDQKKVHRDKRWSHHWQAYIWFISNNFHNFQYLLPRLSAMFSGLSIVVNCGSINWLHYSVTQHTAEPRLTQTPINNGSFTFTILHKLHLLLDRSRTRLRSLVHCPKTTTRSIWPSCQTLTHHTSQSDP